MQAKDDGAGDAVLGICTLNGNAFMSIKTGSVDAIF